MNDTNNTSSEENTLTKAERKALRREEKKQKELELKKAKERKKALRKGIGVAGALLIVFGIGYLFVSSDDKVALDITKECITHQNLDMHIHPSLEIIVNGEEQDIPADIGIASTTCMRPIHTHDDGGKLHAEYHQPRDFTLGEFFQIWEKPFNSQQILDHKVDAEHEIVVTVNGQVNNNYRDIVMNDGDDIVIEYKEKQS